MSEPAAPRPAPGTTTAPLSSPDGTTPPMPYEATNAHTHRSPAAGKWHTAMAPLRKMMRRARPGDA
jgi:hypothetical protein